MSDLEELSIIAQGEMLMAENNERATTLIHKGIQIDMQQLMVRHLVEVLFPTEEARAELNLSFQTMLSSVLDQAESQADRLLLQAKTQPGGLLLPN